MNNLLQDPFSDEEFFSWISGVFHSAPLPDDMSHSYEEFFDPRSEESFEEKRSWRGAVSRRKNRLEMEGQVRPKRMVKKGLFDFTKKKDPSILFYDTETRPLREFRRPFSKAAIKEHQVISVQWVEGKSGAIPQWAHVFPAEYLGGGAGALNEEQKTIGVLVGEATNKDYIVGWNSTQYDAEMLSYRARGKVAGAWGKVKSKNIDMMTIAQEVFTKTPGLNPHRSFSLDVFARDLADALGENWGGKESLTTHLGKKIEGKDIWTLIKDPNDLAILEKYGKKDVELLRKIDEKTGLVSHFLRKGTKLNTEILKRMRTNPEAENLAQHFESDIKKGARVMVSGEKTLGTSVFSRLRRSGKGKFTGDNPLVWIGYSEEQFRKMGEPGGKALIGVQVDWDNQRHIFDLRNDAEHAKYEAWSAKLEEEYLFQKPAVIASQVAHETSEKSAASLLEPLATTESKGIKSISLSVEHNLSDLVNPAVRKAELIKALPFLHRAAPYAAALAIGADVLSSRDKTGPFWGGAAAGLSIVLTRKMATLPRVGIAAGAYVLGRIIGGSIHGNHNPDIEGMGQGYQSVTRHTLSQFGSGWKGLSSGGLGKLIFGSLGIGAGIGIISWNGSAAFGSASTAAMGASIGYLRGGMKGGMIGLAVGAIAGGIVGRGLGSTPGVSAPLAFSAGGAAIAASFAMASTGRRYNFSKIFAKGGKTLERFAKWSIGSSHIIRDIDKVGDVSKLSNSQLVRTIGRSIAGATPFALIGTLIGAPFSIANRSGENLRKQSEISGMRERGEAAIGRKQLTEFGSKWDPLFEFVGKGMKKFGETLEEVISHSDFQKAIREGTVFSKLGEGGVGQTQLMKTFVNQKEFKYVVKSFNNKIPNVEGIAKAEFKYLQAGQGGRTLTPYALWQDKDQWKMAMEYTEGPTLESFLRSGGTVTEEYGKQLADVVNEIAEKTQMYHSDIRGGNIMFQKGNLVLIDPSPLRYSKTYISNSNLNELERTKIGHASDKLAIRSLVENRGGSPDQILDELNDISNAVSIAVSNPFLVTKNLGVPEGEIRQFFVPQARKVLSEAGILPRNVLDKSYLNKADLTNSISPILPQNVPNKSHLNKTDSISPVASSLDQKIVCAQAPSFVKVPTRVAEVISAPPAVEAASLNIINSKGGSTIAGVYTPLVQGAENKSVLAQALPKKIMDEKGKLSPMATAGIFGLGIGAVGITAAVMMRNKENSDSSNAIERRRHPEYIEGFQGNGMGAAWRHQFSDFGTGYNTVRGLIKAFKTTGVSILEYSGAKVSAIEKQMVTSEWAGLRAFQEGTKSSLAASGTSVNGLSRLESETIGDPEDIKKLFYSGKKVTVPTNIEGISFPHKDFFNIQRIQEEQTIFLMKRREVRENTLYKVDRSINEAFLNKNEYSEGLSANLVEHGEELIEKARKTTAQAQRKKTFGSDPGASRRAEIRKGIDAETRTISAKENFQRKTARSMKLQQSHDFGVVASSPKLSKRRGHTNMNQSSIAGTELHQRALEVTRDKTINIRRGVMSKMGK